MESHGLPDMHPKPLTTSKRYGAGMAHTVAPSVMCYPALIIDYCGLLWIIDYHGLWTIMDYCGLFWHSVDYHGLLWILKCAPPWNRMD